jgi:hypothetical protein
MWKLYKWTCAILVWGVFLWAELVSQVGSLCSCHNSSELGPCTRARHVGKRSVSQHICFHCLDAQILRFFNPCNIKENKTLACVWTAFTWFCLVAYPFVFVYIVVPIVTRGSASYSQG